jgi:hypothetical protein
MPPSEDRHPYDLSRQQQCWRQLWKELLKPLPAEGSDEWIVANWPDPRPRLAGFDMLGEFGPPNQPDAGDFDDLEPDV